MSHSQDRFGTSNSSRREFLKASAAAALALTSGPWPTPAGGGEQPASDAAAKLSEHLSVYHGPINVGIVRDGDRALLIDCGDGRVAEALPGLGVKSVAQIVFTHHHRDQACGANHWAAAGAKIGVPEGERELFADPAGYWNDDKNLWRVYASFRPHHLTLTEPLRVDETYADGHEFRFGPATIRVIGTPGHTDGSVSYLVEVDGQRVVFCGDCIYDAGRVWDVFSLQKGFSKGSQRIGGYHGFMGDRWRLVESLARIQALQPKTLIPSHGKVMSEPAKAIGALTERFESCYENYVAISRAAALLPGAVHRLRRPARPDADPAGHRSARLPAALRHDVDAGLQDRAAFVMDVGSNNIVQQFKKMLERGEIKSVEGLWVTHYHFDHTDGIPLFQTGVRLPVHHRPPLGRRDLQPAAWRLPCLAPETSRVHRPMEDGQSWTWQRVQADLVPLSRPDAVPCRSAGRRRGPADVLRGRFAHHVGDRRLLCPEPQLPGPRRGLSVLPVADRKAPADAHLQLPRQSGVHVYARRDPFHAGNAGRAREAVRRAGALGHTPTTAWTNPGCGVFPTRNRPRRASR